MAANWAITEASVPCRLAVACISILQLNYGVCDDEHRSSEPECRQNSLRLEQIKNWTVGAEYDLNPRPKAGQPRQSGLKPTFGQRASNLWAGETCSSGPFVNVADKQELRVTNGFSIAFSKLPSGHYNLRKCEGICRVDKYQLELRGVPVLYCIKFFNSFVDRHASPVN